MGVLLLAHALVIAAYLVHECAHNTLFTGLYWNAPPWAILLWFTGACYGRYEDIRHKHFRISKRARRHRPDESRGNDVALTIVNG